MPTRLMYAGTSDDFASLYSSLVCLYSQLLCKRVCLFLYAFYALYAIKFLTVDGFCVICSALLNR